MGGETVHSKQFHGFHYVALGHLHRAQALGVGQIHYPGSLLKYSFPEAKHTKSVNLVEMDAAGSCKVEYIPLRPKRDVRVVEGCLDDLLRTQNEGISRDDFIKADLLDKGAILNAMGKLREMYPNTMWLDYPMLAVDPNKKLISTDHRTSDVESLFEDFFSQVMGESPTFEEASAFAEIVNKMRQTERESGL